jgi:CDP-diglyceride synthetase
MTVSKSTTSIVKPLVISLFVAMIMTVTWFLFAARMGSALTWFALIAGLDIALLERWTRSNGQRNAKWIAPFATLLCSVLSLWLISALSVSYATGFNLIVSASQMGSGLFTQLLTLRLAPADWLMLASAPLLAYVLAHVGINDRHQSI